MRALSINETKINLIKLRALILFLIAPLFSFSQYSDKRFGLIAGYTFQGINTLQLGGIYGIDYNNVHNISKGFGIAAEISKGNHSIIPDVKIFGEYAIPIFGSRLNMVNYFSNEGVDLRIVPEVGINWVGYSTIYYGYGFPILKDQLSEISKHRITITINLFFRPNQIY